MLGTLICWIVASGIMLSKTTSAEDLYIRTLLAMGFIFLGTLNNAIAAYRDAHTNKNKQNT